MRESMILRSRLLQLLGLLLALVGLIGYWFTRDVDKATLSSSQCELLGLSKDCEGFQASFVVAGRDIFYEPGKSKPVYNAAGKIVAWEYSGSRNANGTQTDTILYVNILNNDIRVIAIPRDIYLPEWERLINAVYTKAGAKGLKETVEGILGLPVDYYAIINTEIFQEFIDALGGVEVNVPYLMDHDDNAGQLHIHLKAGLQVLDGEDAMNFIRYRDLPRGDLDRLDNLKSLGYAVLNKLKAMNVGAAFKLPELLSVLTENVETNVSPALLRKLVARLEHLHLKDTATLPTLEQGSHLRYDVEEVENFIAQTFGGKGRNFDEVPELTLLINNRSNIEGLAERYKERLVAMGFVEENILTAEDDLDPTPSRLLVTSPHWQDADYFVNLFGVSKQQVDSLPSYEEQSIRIELVLGKDASESGVAHSMQNVVATTR
ncbi:MAG: LCP family protein [Trueperaceae bacterium]